MIIAKIQGGLGNQMFQYAFGKMLARRNNTELKLDITMFPPYKLHRYSLDKLNISASIATDEEIAPLVKKRVRKGRRNFLYNFFFADPTKYVLEPSYYFTPHMFELTAPCEVDGYWLSEKYFLEIEDDIRKEFTITGLKNEYTTQMEGKIRATTHPIMLHVRRMDFVHDQAMNKNHGVISPDYYEEAMRIMSEKVPQGSYFVFSDDPEWARQHIHPQGPTEYIGQGAEWNYLDLYLMSLCEHFILANSTYGWWGAWLSKSYRHNTTIIPKFITVSMDTHDLTHPSWIVLDDKNYTARQNLAA
ncbi:alpha-1,2-fucosyltransferase [Candidatus Parcubacteria bacterium]|nr:alpha-1,2-fucosyltransferase [Candidatus Parcubacteria bacterium]